MMKRDPRRCNVPEILILGLMLGLGCTPEESPPEVPVQPKPATTTEVAPVPTVKPAEVPKSIEPKKDEATKESQKPW